MWKKPGGFCYDCDFQKSVAAQVRVEGGIEDQGRDVPPAASSRSAAAVSNDVAAVCQKERPPSPSHPDDRPNRSAAPDARIRFGSSRDDAYGGRLTGDDVVVVPEMFGRELNTTCYHDLANELAEIDGKDEGGGKGFVRVRAVVAINRSQTVRMIRDRLCQYFGIEDVSDIGMCVEICCAGEVCSYLKLRHGPT